MKGRKVGAKATKEAASATAVDSFTSHSVVEAKTTISAEPSTPVRTSRKTTAIVTPTRTPSFPDAATTSESSSLTNPLAGLNIVTPTRTPRSRVASLEEPVSSIKKEFGEAAIEKSPMKSRIVVTKPVENVYKLVRKATGALGGNGHTGAIYGELTMHSMQKVLNYMVDHCELGPNSRFIDIGCGLGKPNFHAAQYPGVRLSLGVELEELRWKLAIHNLHSVLEHVKDDKSPADSVPEIKEVKDKKPKKSGIKKGKQPHEEVVASTAAILLSEAENEGSNIINNSNRELNGGTNFLCRDISVTTTTDPFTHIYQFDLGFEPELHRHIARKFNTSVHARYLVSYRPPHRVKGEYGYAVEEMGSILTSMHGSGEGHTAYFYRRTSAAPAKPLPETNTVSLEIGDETVYSDVNWADGIKQAVGSLADLRGVVDSIYRANLNTGRPVRQRKPSSK